jgi:zinc transporter 9
MLLLTTHTAAAAAAADVCAPAVSDGLAVGAASLSSVPEISLGVATAMVVHKGPVAIGLATFLRSALWSPAQVHRGVLMFAAASPLAAVITYGLLSALPGVTDNIPLVVLFSGGTVLYAATMHILPGAMQSSSSGGKGAQQHQHGGAMNRSQLMLVSLGMLLPLVLSAALGGHHHHH